MSPIHPTRPACRSRRAPSLLAALAAVALLAAACGDAGSTAAPSPSTEPTPTPTAGSSATPAPPVDAAAIYRGIEDQVLELRGLPAKKILEPTIITPAEARKQIAEQYRAQNPPETIATADATLKALGLLAPDASLESLYLDLMYSQAAAFYVPKTKRIFVISKSGSIGAAEKWYFSHEFTHVLQDQEFGPQGTDTNVPGQGDRSLARLSLLEGDAVLLMTQWMSRYLTADELGQLLQVDPEAQAQLARMPAILRDVLMFPYQQGLMFVNGIWARGGWDAVNAAYGRLPDSTEQILHPEKYQAGEKPVTVPIDGAALAKAMGAGWSGTPEDTIGEFELSVWLRENGIKALDAQAAAAGWGGDRLAFLRGPDGAYGLALATTWDTAADATEFLAAATTAVGNLPGVATISPGSDPRSVSIFAASDQATLERLGAAFAAAGV